eukprot:gene11528-316_t
MASSRIIQEIVEREVPALDFYVRHEVFTRDEVGAIMWARRAHEYALASNKVHLSDYMKAIEYELGLEDQVPPTPARHRREAFVLLSCSSPAPVPVACAFACSYEPPPRPRTLEAAGG